MREEDGRQAKLNGELRIPEAVEWVIDFAAARNREGPQPVKAEATLTALQSSKVE